MCRRDDLVFTRCGHERAEGDRRRRHIYMCVCVCCDGGGAKSVGKQKKDEGRGGTSMITTMMEKKNKKIHQTETGMGNGEKRGSAADPRARTKRRFFKMYKRFSLSPSLSPPSLSLSLSPPSLPTPSLPVRCRVRVRTAAGDPAAAALELRNELVDTSPPATPVGPCCRQKAASA